MLSIDEYKDLRYILRTYFVPPVFIRLPNHHSTYVPYCTSCTLHPTENAKKLIVIYVGAKS